MFFPLLYLSCFWFLLKQQSFDELAIVHKPILGSIVLIHSIHVLLNLICYLWLHDYSALGNGPEEVGSAECALKVQVEELEVFEEIGIKTDIREGLELYLLEELGLKTR